MDGDEVALLRDELEEEDDEDDETREDEDDKKNGALQRAERAKAAEWLQRHPSKWDEAIRVAEDPTTSSGNSVEDIISVVLDIADDPSQPEEAVAPIASHIPQEQAERYMSTWNDNARKTLLALKPSLSTEEPQERRKIHLACCAHVGLWRRRFLEDNDMDPLGRSIELRGAHCHA